MKFNCIQQDQVVTQDNTQLLDVEIAERFEQDVEANPLEEIRSLLYELIYLGKEV